MKKYARVCMEEMNVAILKISVVLCGCYAD
jgi:hypothetical protein